MVKKLLPVTFSPIDGVNTEFIEVLRAGSVKDPLDTDNQEILTVAKGDLRMTGY